MLAHKQPTATAYCLKHVRKRYAEAPVIVFENGSNVLSDICAKYKCDYVHQPVNYQSLNNSNGCPYSSMVTVEDFNMFLDQLREAAYHADTEWLLFLEADVLVRSTIVDFPQKSVGGHLHSFNCFDTYTTNRINMLRKSREIPCRNKYIFSCAGGSIMRRRDLRQMLTCDWSSVISDILKEAPPHFLEIRCIDACLSFLFLAMGFEFEEWSEYAELHRCKDMCRRESASVVHGFKALYHKY